jgi:hypothetical protein
MPRPAGEASCPHLRCRSPRVIASRPARNRCPLFDFTPDDDLARLVLQVAICPSPAGKSSSATLDFGGAAVRPSSPPSSPQAASTSIVLPRQRRCFAG